MSDTAGATVREPEISDDTFERKAPDPTLAVDPGLESNSTVVVDLGDTGA